MPAKIRSTPSMLSLVTPSRVIAFTIPTADQPGSRKKKPEHSTDGEFSTCAEALTEFREDRSRRKAHDSSPQNPHKNVQGVEGQKPEEAVRPDQLQGACSLRASYQEACRFHAQLVDDFTKAQQMHFLKRYKRLKAIIMETTREQLVQALCQQAQRQCKCVTLRPRDCGRISRGSRGSESDTLTEVSDVVKGLWLKLTSLVRVVLPSVVPEQPSAPTETDDATDTTTVTTPASATTAESTLSIPDHLHYRSRIVLLKRHLERLRRDYQQSKQSRNPLRRYKAMMAMLRKVTEARLDSV